MRICTVTMPGRYSQDLVSEIRAESLFDAADQFIGYWALTSDWVPDGVITVRCGGKEWRVRAKCDALVEWRCRKHGWPIPVS